VSTPLLAPPDLRLKVRPAEFARMVGVSRQAVSRMIARGTITLLPCGRLDPARATEELLRNSDPSRLRARVLKIAARTHADLVEDIELQDRQIAQLRAALAESERVWRARSSVCVHRDALGELLGDAQGRVLAVLAMLLRHDRPRVENALCSGAVARLLDYVMWKAVWDPMAPPTWTD